MMIEATEEQFVQLVDKDLVEETVASVTQLLKYRNVQLEFPETEALHDFAKHLAQAIYDTLPRMENVLGWCTCMTPITHYTLLFGRCHVCSREIAINVHAKANV